MPPKVMTSHGAVIGVESDGVISFKGVRYAAPPIGDLRFAAPKPPEAWIGELDCSEYGPISLQHLDPLSALIPGCEWNFYRPGAQQSEDCLNLNVWTPDTSSSLPVMFWIHGGALLAGSGTGLWTDGAIFAREQNVVVVTINYRLGALGFLVAEDPLNETGSTSNNGLLDQIAALRWVQENIRAFGGDPSHVCIFGESAGAMSVMTLLGTPSARGLFTRAIVQSGHHEFVRTMEEAQRTSEMYLGRFGATGKDVISRLRGVDANELMSAQAALTVEIAVPFTMVIDGQLLPERPIDAIAAGSAANIPLIIGSNSDENRLFRALGWGPGMLVGSFHERIASRFTSVETLQRRTEWVKDLLGLYSTSFESEIDLEEEISNDSMWRAPIQELIDTYQRAGGTVFSYEFGYSSAVRGGEMRACHVMEIPFVFGNLHQPGVNEFVGDQLGEGTDARRLSTSMNAAWASFADNGVPSGRDLPAWSSSTEPRHSQMYLSNRTYLRDDPHFVRTTWLNEHKSVMVPPLGWSSESVNR